MTYTLFKILSISMALCAAPSADKPTTKIQAVEDAQVVQSVKCTLGKEERILEVFPKKAGCNLQYFKAGKNNEIAAYRNGVDPCKEKLRQVKVRLEGAGYHCQ